MKFKRQDKVTITPQLNGSVMITIRQIGGNPGVYIDANLENNNIYILKINITTNPPNIPINFIVYDDKKKLISITKNFIKNKDTYYGYFTSCVSGDTRIIVGMNTAYPGTCARMCHVSIKKANSDFIIY